MSVLRALNSTVALFDRMTLDSPIWLEKGRLRCSVII